MLSILTHPNLDPVIFWVKKPELALRWYGLMYVLAFLAGYAIFRWLQKSGYLRVKFEDVSNYIIVGVLGTFLGGRLGYVLFYQFDKLFLGKGVEDGWERLGLIYRVWDGGMSFHGGVFGVTLAVLFYSWRKRHNFWNIMDASTLVVPLGVALVRIGNFINGELYGRTINDSAGNPITDPDKLPWYAMKFPTDHHTPGARRILEDALRDDYLAANPDATRIPGEAMQPLPIKAEVWDQVSAFFPGRYPSQLVQFFFEGLLVLAAMWLLRRHIKRPGIMAGLFLIAYAVFRIPAEVIRQPDAQIDPAQAEQLGGTAAFLASLGLTMGQLLSFVIIAMGAGVILWRMRRPAVQDYTADERRSGFWMDTIKDLPQMLGFRRKQPDQRNDV